MQNACGPARQALQRLGFIQVAKHRLDTLGPQLAFLFGAGS